MKVLITGASGLLGHDVVAACEHHGHSVIKWCNQQRDGYYNGDLTDDETLSTIDAQDWDCIIHTAALRVPDLCMKEPERAMALNATATGALAKLAAQRNATMVYISTDYVFRGDTPPYKENDATDPLNEYGLSKLMGEKALLKELPEAIILRIPYLYGIRGGLSLSPLLMQTLSSLTGTTPWPMNDLAKRFPTFTGDVAEASLFLLENNHTGIYHCSGEDEVTRYSITKIFAELLDLPMTHIIRQLEPPTDQATRPNNSQLSPEKLFTLGFPRPLPFRKRIAEILKSPEVVEFIATRKENP